MVMKIRSLLIPLLIVAAPPAAADVPRPTLSAVDAQSALSGYSAWLTKLDAVEHEALDGLRGMGPSWDRAMATHNGNRAAAIFRPEMARLKALLAATNARLQALDKPDFTMLKLSPDLEPAQLVQSYVSLNMQISAVVDSYGPMLVAVQHNDLQGVRRAATAALRGLGLTLDSQMLMAQAHQATVPQESSQYELTGLHVDFYRAAARIIKAPVVGGSRRDPELARQLSIIADDCEHIATSGAAKQAREIGHYRELRAQAAAAGEADRVALLDRVIAVSQADSAVFPLADRFAKLLRVHATTLKAQPVTVDLADAMMVSLRPYHEALSDISRAENAAMGSNPQP
jgi:hypothetical protein